VLSSSVTEVATPRSAYTLQNSRRWFSGERLPVKFQGFEADGSSSNGANCAEANLSGIGKKKE
jgi:hypothetical protein